MTIMMNHRQVVEEIATILGTDTVLSCSTIHFEDGQYERLRFLMEWLAEDFAHLPAPTTCVIDINATKSITLTFHTDSGHGWVGVSMDVLRELRVDQDISSYSYLRADMAYLEEDADMPTFMAAAKANGYHVNLTDQYTSGDSWIRNLPHYKVSS